MRPALLLLVAGCAIDAPPPPPPTGTPAPFIDCGTVVPNLTASCNDGEPARNLEIADDDEAPVPEGPPGLSREVTMDCDLGLDVGRTPQARLRATCERVLDEVVFTARLTLEGHVERRCGYGAQGSQGEARPLWRARVLPPGPVLARFTAEATSATRCEVRLGQSLTTVRPGAVTDFLEELAAPTPLVIDCTGEPALFGLAVSGCYGYVDGAAASPPAATERVELTIRMAPR